MDGLSEDVQDKLFAYLRLLEERGPQLGRPYVDTLHGSKLSNLKELRFKHKGTWRFAFVFDPEMTGILLIGGDKEGQNQKKFYKQLIAAAERRYADHLSALSARRGEKDDHA